MNITVFCILLILYIDINCVEITDFRINEGIRNGLEVHVIYC